MDCPKCGGPVEKTRWRPKKGNRNRRMFACKKDGCDGVRFVTYSREQVEAEWRAVQADAEEVMRDYDEYIKGRRAIAHGGKN